MNNPLNELSAVYQDNIAEGDCGCDDKKKAKMKVKPEVLPQGDTPMGGDGARPGKNRKSYVEPMSYEGYAPGDVDKKVGAVTPIPKKERDAAKERLLAKAKAKREAMKEGHCDEKGVECSDVEKKKDAKKMKEDVYSNWREGWEFLDEYNMANYGTGDSEKNLGKTFAKTDKKAGEKITEKKVKNTIKINPPQGMGECFAELGGVIHEVYEITEKIDIEKADMGEVIKDFRKSKAPQFKGKSKEKKQEMAVAAKLATEETEEEKKKREQLQQKTKDHDDKQSGKIAEATYGGEEAEKKAKIEKFKKGLPPGKGFQGKYDQYGREYDTNTGKLKEGALSGVLSTIRSKNGMKDITAKGKDKIQDKKDKSMCEDNISELNRYEKETGTSSGSMNMPKGRPTQKGGEKSPAMRAVRQMMRSQTGKPEGQRKPSERMKRPTGPTPAQKVQKRRDDAKRAQDNMSSRFD